jgi:hypothetical protein
LAQSTHWNRILTTLCILKDLSTTLCTNDAYQNSNNSKILGCGFLVDIHWDDTELFYKELHVHLSTSTGWCFLIIIMVKISRGNNHFGSWFKEKHKIVHDSVIYYTLVPYVKSSVLKKVCCPKNLVPLSPVLGIQIKKIHNSHMCTWIKLTY